MENRIQLSVTNVDYKRKDPVFWIEVQTNLTKYKQKQKRFPRYYSELEKLHDHLFNTLDDVLIPALPPCPIPRFDREGLLVGKQWWLTIRLPGESPPDVDAGLVQERIQVWFDRIASHERAKTSEGLREFVESEIGFRPSVHKAHKSTKHKHVIVNVSEQDMEPEFGQCLKELENFCHHLGQLSLKLDKLVQEQTGTAQNWMSLSSSWVSYGGIERNPNLFILYKTIAKGYQQAFDLERSQALAVNETLGEEISYELKNCEATQNAMQRRLNALSDYLSSRKYTESSLRGVERLKSSINIDPEQANDAIAQLEHARINERDKLQRFKRVDTNLRNDIEQRYKPQVVSDLIKSIKQYAKSQLYLERKKLRVYEGILDCRRHLIGD